MMEIKPIYDNAWLLFTALLSVLVLVGPPSIASLIARRKGHYFIALGYFFYSFIGTPVVYMSIYYASSGALRYFLVGLILPLYMLAPIWHARRSPLSEKLQRASEARGIKLQSCYYCYEPFDAESTVCPICHHRTPSSLMVNRYVVLFALSILSFVFALFMAMDEYLHDSNTYNMLSALFDVLTLLPYVVVAQSTVFFAIFFLQLFAVMACFFYTAGIILQTAHRLSLGKLVSSPTILFFVALYITVGHPLLFWAFTIEKEGERALEVSLGWAFWVISYLLLWVSVYSLHTEKKDQDEFIFPPRISSQPPRM